MNKIQSVIFSVLKRIYRTIKPSVLSDEDAIVQLALKSPRYTEIDFQYKNFHFHVSDFISVAYQIKEYFGDNRMKFITENINPIIIDCGANVGVSVIYFKTLYPNAIIEAFEPDAKVMACLKENIAANNIKGVNLNQKAVWKNNDGIEFGVEGADGGSIFLEGKKTTHVETVRLKELLASLKEVDVLKIDIEGAETEVIKDCNEELKKVKYLFVEYHSWIANKQELNELLEVLTKNGFRYYIHSIGAQTLKPFMNVDSYNGMDVQLDIYAVNKNK